MIPFKRFRDALVWFANNAKGPVCIIQANQRMLLPSQYPGDMRLLETKINGEWI